MEQAMKLMEKDIHEKQDTIISLRRQLEDIKIINLEMYRKLQVNTNKPLPRNRILKLYSLTYFQIYDPQIEHEFRIFAHITSHYSGTNQSFSIALTLVLFCVLGLVLLH
jgi:hypothetical protein